MRAAAPSAAGVSAGMSGASGVSGSASAEMTCIAIVSPPSMSDAMASHWDGLCAARSSAGGAGFVSPTPSLASALSGFFQTQVMMSLSRARVIAT